VDNMVALLCSQSFPKCTLSAAAAHTVHTLISDTTVIKTCHAGCVGTFQSCGVGFNQSYARCNAMSSSTQQHLSRSSVTRTCAPLPHISKSDCVLASGLATCSMSNGLYVSLNTMMFSSLEDADAYVAHALSVVAGPGARFAVCAKSAAILLCSQFLPQCDSQDGDRVRMCHATCADAIWNCNFDGVHNFSNACDGVGWDNLDAAFPSPSTEALSSYVSAYVAPPVASALDPTAQTCGYASLPELVGVSNSRLNARSASSCLNPANCPGAELPSTSVVSDSVFIASLVMSVVGALLIGAFIGWMAKARQIQKSNVSHHDVTLDHMDTSSTPYAPLVSQ